MFVYNVMLLVELLLYYVYDTVKLRDIRKSPSFSTFFRWALVPNRLLLRIELNVLKKTIEYFEPQQNYFHLLIGISQIKVARQYILDWLDLPFGLKDAHRFLSLDIICFSKLQWSFLRGSLSESCFLFRTANLRDNMNIHSYFRVQWNIVCISRLVLP